MSPDEFFRAVWPRQGHYCIAWRFQPPGVDTTVWAHKVFSSAQDAISFAAKKGERENVWFATFSLREPEIWNAEKQKHQKRVQANSLAARSFFLDIDVGPDDKKYATLEEAVKALRDFVVTNSLPKPILVASGSGLHVYWPITEDVSATSWRTYAGHLKQLTNHFGLRADHSRTTDSASVLRIPGTSNFKDAANPQPVRVIAPGEFSTLADFAQALSDAVIRTGEQPAATPTKQAYNPFGASNITDDVYDGPRPDIRDVGTACRQFRELAAAKGDVPEPAWYSGIVGTALYMTAPGMTSHQLVHRLSQGHKHYTAADTDEKIAHWEEAVGKPARCETIASATQRPDICAGCPFANDPSVPNPIVAAVRSTRAEPPKVLECVGEVNTTTEIPNPPAPFLRLKTGGVAAVVKTGDDVTDEKTEIIYPYDLYPLKRLANPTNGTEQHLWRAALPRDTHKDFLLDADALYDQRKFVVSISNHGIYPHRSQLSRLQEYMTAYISELQRLVDADIQFDHLGWSDDYSEFVLPDKKFRRDGSVISAALSVGAQRASASIHRKGTLQRQVELLDFYSRPQYIPQQCYIGASLGATIYHMTGHHGVIVNASGAAGASKSTALYASASNWGHPEDYTINGTKSGATARARNERVSVLANLPVCVDEITHMNSAEAHDLAMGITQPGHRLRLNHLGVERATPGGVKSTIMLTTANSSLHGLLSMDNTAGTAGSMRVVEIPFEAQHVHQKHEADAFLHDLKENFGWVGESFIYYVMKNYDAVKARVRAKVVEIDTLINTQSSERFYSAFIACVLVALEIARDLGLLRYNVEMIKEWWAVRQMPYMRGIVSEEYSDPLSIVADYLEIINQNIISVSKPDIGGFATGNISNIQQKPHGELLAHYDMTTGIMYVLRSGFKKHCARIGANAVAIINELGRAHPHELLDEEISAKVVIDPRVRRTLGAGTEYAKAQTWNFALNMRHPLVAGKPQIRAVTAAANDKAA